MLLCVFVPLHLSSTTKILNRIYIIKQATLVLKCRLFNGFTYIEADEKGFLTAN